MNPDNELTQYDNDYQAQLSPETYCDLCGDDQDLYCVDKYKICSECSEIF